MKSKQKTSVALLAFTLLSSSPAISRADEVWSDGRPANLVLGQADFQSKESGMGNTRLNTPDGVAIDPVSGKVFVSDRENHRVLRYPNIETLENGAAAEAVLGQADFDSVTAGSSSTRLNSPRGLAIDGAGNLWVADTNNNRVVRFSSAADLLSGSAANSVLGQADFDSNVLINPPNAASLNFPVSVAVASTGHLLVRDSVNRRIVAFGNAAGLSNGANADFVIGQDDFQTVDTGTTRTRISGTGGLAFDAANRLWVADGQNCRVLRFDPPFATGMNAAAVIGQTDFESKESRLARNGMGLVDDVAISPEGSLWISDLGNRRLLRVEDPSTKSFQVNADGVIGQMDFETNAGLPTEASAEIFFQSQDIAMTQTGDILACDDGFNRVLRFSPGDYQPDNQIGKKKKNLKGGDRHNTSGAGQKITLVSKNRRKLKFHGAFGNDGPSLDQVTLKGTKKNRYFRVKYFDTTAGKKNITGAVTRGTHAVDFDYQASNTCRIEVKPKRRAEDRRKTRKFKLTGTSDTDPAQRDRIQAIAKTKP